MLGLDFLGREEKNKFARQGLIPLGLNTSARHGLETYPWHRIMAIPEKWLGLVSLISQHSSGKSVLLKRIACYWHWIWPRRPGIIFDMQGVDWRTIRNKGKEGLIFKAEGEEYWGFGKKVHNFTPLYLADELPIDDQTGLYNDRVFGIGWRDLTMPEWEELLSGVEEGRQWSHKFKYHLEQNKHKITSFKDFIKAIEEAIKERFTQGKDAIISEMVPEYLSANELIAMVGSLKPIYKSGFLLEDNDPRRIDVINEIKPGEVLVFNFHGDRSAKTRIYNAHLMRRVREYYKKLAKKTHPHLPNTPWIIWEEADHAAPSDGGSKNSISGQQMVELITKDMKVGFKLAIICQMLSRMHAQVRKAMVTDPILIARPTPQDVNEISAGRDSIVYTLKSLDGRRDDHRTLEWCYIDDAGQTLRTFRPAASPCEFLQRFGKDGASA